MSPTRLHRPTSLSTPAATAIRTRTRRIIVTTCTINPQQRDSHPHPHPPALSPLDASRRLSCIRSIESSGRPTSTNPLFIDPFASLLCSESATSTTLDQNNNQQSTSSSLSPLSTYFDVIATRFLDDQVLLATANINTSRNQEYNQVVLVGDGYCTRPFRLPWPTGTVIYLVAPGEVHERAEAVLASANVRVPRGCLLRRIDCNIIDENSSCMPGLNRAGYRPDRLSVWAIQGIRKMDMSAAALASIFADVSNSAALESIVVGELPATSPREVDSLLASFGLLGTTYDAKAVAEYFYKNEYSEEEKERGACWWWEYCCGEDSGGGSGKKSMLFRGQQRRLSLAEIELYESHVAAAEEVDEDFFGNFS